MALEFTHIGKKLILHNMFGVPATSLTQYLQSNNQRFPSLCGSPALNLGDNFCIHFYAGTRPSILDLPLDWQGTAYSNTTKMFPITTSFSSINDVLSASGSLATALSSKITIDWENNTVSFPATGNLATNIFMNSGTVSWFAMYAGLSNGDTDGAGWKLAWTGSVGLTGSGADIEFNRVDIPSSSYPININQISFNFSQATLASGEDVVFSKNIYTTSLANLIGAGVGLYSSGGGVYYNVWNSMSSSISANARYVNGGSTANKIDFYYGTRPNSPDEAIPGDNVLVGSVNTFQMNFVNMTETTTSSEVSLAKTGNYTGTAVAVANPNWCRIMSATSSGYAAIDCSAGLPGSNSVMVYNDPISEIGQSINVTSIKFALT